MTFLYDRTSGKIIDPDDGAELRTIRSHPHATESIVGIFDYTGRKTFTATFRSYSIDVSRDQQQIDPPGQKTLLDASVEENGRWKRVLDDHPDLDRLIEYYRTGLEAKTNVDRFVLLDLRKRADK